MAVQASLERGTFGPRKSRSGGFLCGQAELNDLSAFLRRGPFVVLSEVDRYVELYDLCYPGQSSLCILPRPVSLCYLPLPPALAADGIA